MRGNDFWLLWHIHGSETVSSLVFGNWVHRLSFFFFFFNLHHQYSDCNSLLWIFSSLCYCNNWFLGHPLMVKFISICFIQFTTPTFRVFSILRIQQFWLLGFSRSKRQLLHHSLSQKTKEAILRKSPSRTNFLFLFSFYIFFSFSNINIKKVTSHLSLLALRSWWRRREANSFLSATVPYLSFLFLSHHFCFSLFLRPLSSFTYRSE